MADMNLQINATKIVHQTVDDEVIAINLENGDYYSLVDTAAVIWRLIVQQPTPPQIVEALLTAYEDLEDATVSAEVSAFLAALEEEEIIVRTAAPEDAVSLTMDTQEAAYATPVMEKHTNMSDLLLLDPIHDVDEQGWPVRKK